MRRSSSQHPRHPRRMQRQANADLLRQIGDELVTFRDGPPEGSFDFGDPAEISEMSRRERMLRVLWAEALDGSLKAIQMILDYTDGRPAQAMALSGEVRLTADEYAQIEKQLSAWRASVSVPASPGGSVGERTDDGQ